jgi:hypothetical protein
MKTGRRNFVKLTTAAGAGLIVSAFSSSASADKEIKFAGTVDGDMLTEYDGIVRNGSLYTKVRLKAPAGMHLRINGVKARFSEGIYQAEIALSNYRNEIEITTRRSGTRQSIIVYWLRNYTNKYRLSLDDNILFLKDISLNSSKYNSIFENPYLGFLREVHDKYRTKIHINIYYQTEGFNLSGMTDKYKEEWRQNSDWLRLSFHALQNDPDKPYINAGYSQVKKDCEMVMKEIRRFAGDELLGPVTTLHWGEARVEGCRALRDCGYKALTGYYNSEDGKPVVSYYLDTEKANHVTNRSIWCDNEEGIIHKKIHLVINSYPLNEIVPLLDKIKTDKIKSSFIDLMIHEQYFYPSYHAYQPDFKEKVMTAVKWASDNGYKPSFLSDSIFD